uniref:WD repeat domain phosphoinositide-interacting protein 2 n=1 Tax=Loa loa TaxID=7209 RepID=A0A1I7VZC3_LOALO
MAESLPGTSSTPAKTPSKDETDLELLYLSFSRNLDRLTTAGNYGFTVYRTMDNETPRMYYELCRRPLQKEYTLIINDVILIECFPPIHKYAVVLGKFPCALHFYDITRNSCTGITHFPGRILSIKSCSQSSFADLQYYDDIVYLKTPPNFSVLMDLTGEERPQIAYPDSSTTGFVAIHDICSHLHAKKLINAHNHPIAALCLNNDATMVATASNIATVIRIHNVRRCECIFVFRRGIARSVTVHSMAFSADSRFLCLTSNTETIHVFKLEGTLPKLLLLEDEVALQIEERTAPPQPFRWSDYLAGSSRAAAEYLAPTRDFASAILPEIGNLNVAGLKKIGGRLHLLAATSTRKFFSFEISEEGGIAKLINNGGKLSTKAIS